MTSEPVQDLKHLGLGINTATGMFYATEYRLDRVNTVGRSLLTHSRTQKGKVPARQLTSFVGLTQNLHLAIPAARFLNRSLHHCLETRTDWNGMTRLTNQARRDIGRYLDLVNDDDVKSSTIESGTTPDRRVVPDEPRKTNRRRHRSNAWWCDVSVVYSKPGAPDQDWHCDGRHLAGEARADFSGAGAAPPYAVCVFCPLINLDENVGFTRFWAGSHVADGLIGFGAAAEVLRGCVDGTVDKGGYVAYDYRTMHRGMRNASVDTTRPVLQFLYARSNYRETKNYGASSVFRPAT